MRLRQQVADAVALGNEQRIEDLVSQEVRAIRHMLGLTYSPNGHTREVAARGVAIASRHHPRLVQNLVRRLVWAMNEESGSHAVTAPAVVVAIAHEQPKMLLPMVPDLIRLAADESLREGLVKALEIVTERCPGKVGLALQRELNKYVKRDQLDEI